MDINIDPSFSRTANADTALSSCLGLDISIALVAAQATYPDQYGPSGSMAFRYQYGPR